MKYLTETGAIQAANTRGNDALLPAYVIDLQAAPYKILAGNCFIVRFHATSEWPVRARCRG